MTEGYTRRRFLKDAGIGAGTCLVLGPSGLRAAGGMGAGLDPASTPFKSLAESKGLLFGAAATQNKMMGDPAYTAIIAQQCDLYVPELALKWDALRPTPQTYDFKSADWSMQFVQQHQMKMRGHTLVWHSALPKWFDSYANKQNAKPLLLDHIKTVVGRYSGKMQSWDVINEAMNPSDKRPDGLRNSPWMQLIGPDYIDMAFRAAAEADPKAMLVWNENWLEEDQPGADKKREQFLQVLKGLRSRGVPIHAIGLQSHLTADHANIIAGPGVQKFLSQVGDLGLKILVSELDVTDQKLPGDVGARDKAVADVYYNYLNTVLANKAVIAVILWGLTNKYSWIATRYPRADSAAVRPLPFDENMQPSLAWDAIAKALNKAPSR